MALTAEELKAIKDKVTSDAAAVFEKQNTELQGKVDEKVNAAFEKLEKGMIKKEEFQGLVDASLKEYGEKASKLEEVMRAQGEAINGLTQVIKAPTSAATDITEILKPHVKAIKDIYKAGSGFIRIDFKDVQRKAAETSIANSIQNMTSPPGSPYAPGISSTPLTVYEIARNPTFVSHYVDMGTTDQSRLAWINETSLVGLPTLVLEGASKPLTQRTFQVNYSVAKKIAAYIGITEEFDQDLPYLSTAVRRLLQMDVVRAFDLQVQADVQTNATQLTLSTQLGPNNLTLAAYKNQIFDATLYDGLFAMGTAVRLANFIPNISLLNPVTYGKLLMTKDAYGRYNTPPQEMLSQINPQQGNNLWPDYAIVGDLKQFKVDIYEDFSLKVGWINDDLIRNQFTIVAEVRFHDYISTARQQAIMYADAKYIAEQISGGSNVPIGS